MDKGLGFMVGGGAEKSIPLNELDRFFPTLFGGRETERSAIALYSLVAWTYRCIQILSNGVMSIPWTLSRRGIEDSEIELEATPYGDVDWDWLWWRTEAARLIWGASYWLKLPGDLQWLNPGTMAVNTNSKQGITGFTQSQGNGSRLFSKDQIVYLPTFSPRDDLLPGVSAAQVAKPPGALVANANAWTAKFFERGALPATVLSTDGNIPDEEIERVESVWERLFGGVKNAFKTAVLRRGLKPTVIGFPLKDLALPELMETQKEQLSVIFGIPQSMLDTRAANFATAKQDDINLYTKTIFPQMRLVAGSVNRQLWWPMGYEQAWEYGKVEAIQQDEAEKAEGTAMLMEEVDRQKTAGILTRDRAVWMTEQLWSQIGYDFPEDMPDEEPEEPEPQAPGQIAPEMLQQQQAVSQAAQATPPPPAKAVKVDNLAMLESLRRWRRKSRNRKGACEFESDNVPDWVGDAIKARLEADWETAFDPFLKATALQGTLEGRLRKAIAAIYEKWAPKITRATLSNEVLDLAPMYTEIQAATELMYQEAVTSGVLAQAAEMGWGVEYEDLLTDSLERAGEAGNVLVKRISGTDTKFINKIKSQLAAGEITEDAARELLEKTFGPVRSTLIAVTETTRAMQASSDALQADLAAQNVETVQRWLTAEDERVCPVCGPLDHTTEETWREQIPEGPPAHVNCRCVTVVERVR